MSISHWPLPSSPGYSIAPNKYDSLELKKKKGQDQVGFEHILNVLFLKIVFIITKLLAGGIRVE